MLVNGNINYTLFSDVQIICLESIKSAQETLGWIQLQDFSIKTGFLVEMIPNTPQKVYHSNQDDQISSDNSFNLFILF